MWHESTCDIPDFFRALIDIRNIQLYFWFKEQDRRKAMGAKYCVRDASYVDDAYQDCIKCRLCKVGK